MGPLKADIYVADNDMVIEIHGPHHYKNGTDLLMDSSIYTDKIFKKYHKNYVSIPYGYYDYVKTYGMNEDYEKGALLLQEIIK